MSRQIVSLFLIFAQISFLKSEDPIVQLEYGQIRGRQDITAANKTYYAFEKIPFATPPVGDLRFKAPFPPEKWDGILNTTKLDVQCYQMKTGQMQPGLTESEDCLYMNIFTPRLPSPEDKEPLPTMVYIYGGGFFAGSAAQYPPDLFINQAVIFVAFNYRLGPFGYLSTQDSVIPGNYGLHDQANALKFVNQNIHLFGGDPNKVTIFGQSAGAASVAYLLLSPAVTAFFQGAILESGTFLSPSMFQRNARDVTFGIASIIDPKFRLSNDTEAVYDLLVNLEAENLNTASSLYMAATTNSWDGLVDSAAMFTPVLESKEGNIGYYIDKKMYVALEADDIVTVPTLMGFTSEEKIGSYSDPDALEDIAKYLDFNLDDVVPADMQISASQNLVELGGKIREIYTGGEPFADHLGAAIRYSSDNFLTRPMIKHAQLLSNFTDTYFYQFSYDGNSGVHYDDAGNVGHGAELKYLFCSGAACTEGVSEADLLQRERMISLWTNFARYRNPTPTASELFQNIIWPSLSPDSDDFFYLDIGENLEVKNHPKEETYSKWIELYDNLDYDDFDTY